MASEAVETPTQTTETHVAEAAAATGLVSQADVNPDDYQLYPVDWQIGDDWVEIDHADPLYTEAKIWRYKLVENDKYHPYDYKLSFSNLKHHDYAFQFGSGEWQTKSTYRNGEHSIDFTFDQPNVIQVGWKP